MLGRSTHSTRTAASAIMNPSTKSKEPDKHTPALDAAAIRAKEKEFLFPATAHYYKEPIVLDSGRGMRVRDTDGREYLDFFGGILTLSLGHCHPGVNAALKMQMDRLGHVSTLYPTLP